MKTETTTDFSYFKINEDTCRSIYSIFLYDIQAKKICFFNVTLI